MTSQHPHSKLSCLCAEKPLRSYTAIPRNRSTASLSSRIGLPKPGSMSSEMWRLNDTRLSEQQKKKNTSSPLAIRDKSYKFLCRSRILAYTTRHDLREAFGPGFFSTTDDLSSLKRPKQRLFRMPINKEFDIQQQ